MNPTLLARISRQTGIPKELIMSAHNSELPTPNSNSNFSTREEAVKFFFTNASDDPLDTASVGAMKFVISTYLK